MQTHQHAIRISCIICTYRRVDVLAAAIESVIDQTIPADSYEVIVVDNNSGDTTAEIVRRCVEQAPERVRYVLEVQQGLSHARNRGISEARGDIVAFLDDDAVADPNWLQELLATYDAIPDAWAVGGKVLPIWEGTRPDWLHDSLLRMVSLIDWGDAARPLHWPERIIGANCSFRQIVFSEIGPFDTNLGRKGTNMIGSEDTEIQQRIHKLKKYVYYTPSAVVHHHVPRSRMTRKYFFSRSFGHGRTLALLTAQQDGNRVLFGHTLYSIVILPYQMYNKMKSVLSKRIPGLYGRIWSAPVNDPVPTTIPQTMPTPPQNSFSFARGLVSRVGFIYQAALVLIDQQRHRKSGVG